MTRLPTYEPMMAQSGSLPMPKEEAAYGVELKWDGVRAIAYIEDGKVRLVSRNARDISMAYPELQLMSSATRGHRVVLDGEIVAFDDDGRPNFGALQARMHQRKPMKIVELVATVPVTYLAFDLLHIDDLPTIGLPYLERRELLEATVIPGYRWQVPVAFRGQAQRVLDAARDLALEGIVCKRLTSPYRPGKRSAEWMKVKNFAHTEVIICGWKPGGGRRSGLLGSLLLGAHDEAGRLVYVGHVGTGFTAAMLRDLQSRLEPLEQPQPPYELPAPREHARDAHWVQPVLVGEVQYGQWTGDHRLRHPSWRGLRPDKSAREVIQPGLRATG